MNQELITFGIVGIVALVLSVRFFRKYVAGILSQWFLRRGQIKLAMVIRKFEKAPICESCEPSSTFVKGKIDKSDNK
ncbi:MAG: hypothetical protein AABZ55_12645 [Bdellovibrionota bacterium]